MCRGFEHPPLLFIVLRMEPACLRLELARLVASKALFIVLLSASTVLWLTLVVRSHLVFSMHYEDLDSHYHACSAGPFTH